MTIRRPRQVLRFALGVGLTLAGIVAVTALKMQSQTCETADASGLHIGTLVLSGCPAPAVKPQ